VWLPACQTRPESLTVVSTVVVIVITQCIIIINIPVIILPASAATDVDVLQRQTTTACQTKTATDKFLFQQLNERETKLVGRFHHFRFYAPFSIFRHETVGVVFSFSDS